MELRLNFCFKQLDKEKAFAEFDKIRQWDSVMLDKLMFENDNVKTKVLCKSANDESVIFTKLQQSEGIRQMADLFQTKHNEMQQIYDVLFS